MKHLRLLIAVTIVSAPLSIAPGAAADCGAPELSVRPAWVAVGDELVITGEYWNDVCNDTGGGVGCWSSSTDSQPTQDIVLIAVDRDSKERFVLGTVDANEDLEFSFTTTVDLPPGWYVLRDERGESYVSNANRFRVVRPGVLDGAGG